MLKWQEKIKNLTKGLYLNSEWSKSIQYFPNSLTSPGKFEIVFVMGQANKVIQMKLWLFLVIWVHDNTPQSRNLQSDMKSQRKGLVVCLNSNNHTLLSLETPNMEPPLLWPKNCWILDFLTDPIPVLSKWLEKAKNSIVWP